jgi:hypothetical protein
LRGEKNDTAYLFSFYRDPGASIFEYKDSVANCYDYSLVSDVTGTVDTRLPGKYLITYNATNSVGKALAAVTRTVHVVENKAGFLNGNYLVVCTCTAVPSASSVPILSTTQYTASVNSSSVNSQFEISKLKVGPIYVVPHAPTLDGNSIHLGFYHPDFLNGNDELSGILSAAKNTFTISSMVYQYTPVIRYTCNNVYSKQLILKQ